MDGAQCDPLILDGHGGCLITDQKVGISSLSGRAGETPVKAGVSLHGGSGIETVVGAKLGSHPSFD